MALPLKRGLGAIAVAAAAATVLLTGPAAGYATAGTVAGTVDSPVPLKVRAGASADTALVGTLRSGGRATVTCQQAGQWIHGKIRATNLWDRLADGRYISDAYVRRAARVRIPACAAAPVVAPAAAPAPPSGVTGTWVVPVPGRPGQGFRPASNPFHQGVDILEPRGTAVRAASAGVVITVVCNTSGTTCDVDGNPGVRGCGWYAEIQHPGGVITRYCHLIHQPAVTVGQVVVTGQVIGNVGTSGNSSAPHLHFEVHLGAAPANPLNAVDPVAFMRSVGAPLGGPG
jgi:murein DD-endopeptidase MepM/ murein hydrolase activator NlpD